MLANIHVYILTAVTILFHLSDLSQNLRSSVSFAHQYSLNARGLGCHALRPNVHTCGYAMSKIQCHCLVLCSVQLLGYLRLLLVITFIHNTCIDILYYEIFISVIRRRIDYASLSLYLIVL